MTADVDQVASLLREAAETHHSGYRIADGEDPDWASWYADWLVRLSELPELLNTQIVRSELTYMLVKLDRDYNQSKAEEPWEQFYARGLLAQFDRAAVQR